MTDRIRVLVLAAAASALGLGVIALTPDLAARPRDPYLPPDSFANCRPGPYVGPNGGVCTPVAAYAPGALASWPGTAEQNVREVRSQSSAT